MTSPGTAIDYQSLLNPAQLEAVTTLEGPVLVIAGAGSGKTRTLVYRVARLVESGISPESILLLTFTRKAAAEMLERAAGLADDRCRRVSGGTFHSLAHQVLRAYAWLVGYENSFTILDRADMEEVIQSLVKKTRTETRAVRFPKRSTLASILSKAVNLQKPVESIVEEEFPHFLHHLDQIQRLAGLYSDFKRENQLMDYDDLLVLLSRLLSENEDVRIRLSRRYRYIMVDEYQDTNGLQAEIVRLLASEHQNVMVVGDDSQSIYAFRGADYRNMFEFPGEFPEAKIIKLEENYRSTQPILSFTNALMERAQRKYSKCLRTSRAGGELPLLVDAGTETEQAAFVRTLARENLSKGRRLSDMAVLFRAGYHSFELELELARHGLPFVKYGGFKFMESAHIKDLLAHLRVVVNPEDAVSMGRVLRMVKGIGPGKSQSIIEWLKKNGLEPLRLAEWPGAGTRGQGLKTLASVLKELSVPERTPGEAFEIALAYYEPILKQQFDDFPKRRIDLNQLGAMTSRYKTLRSFLDDLALEPPTSSAELASRDPGDRLTLSTVHSAKGLEWPVVVVIWVMEGYFPPARAYSNQEGLEEERRLLYVAATRAKDELILCYPGMEARPMRYGSNGREAFLRGEASCFVQELPEEVLCRVRGGRAARCAAAPALKKAVPGQRSRDMGGLRPGDRVRHPAFGAGVVARLQGKDKVEVLFRNAGRKLLHLEYTTLDRV
ncbi:MAG: ATP-dependent helicase [Desulfobacteraceae bacterium]